MAICWEIPTVELGRGESGESWVVKMIQVCHVLLLVSSCALKLLVQCALTIGYTRTLRLALVIPYLVANHPGNLDDRGPAPQVRNIDHMINSLTFSPLSTYLSPRLTV